MSYLQNVVVHGIQNPTIAPQPGANPGDTWIQTSDGTATGIIQAHYVFDGTSWRLLHGVPTATTFPTGGRNYHTNTTAFIPTMATVPTAATIAGWGFTTGGSATLAGDAVYQNQQASILLSGLTQKTTADIFTPPANFARHEVAITQAAHNTYFMKVIGDRAVTVEVWVCDPVTGNPVERLAAKTPSCAAAPVRLPVQLSPKEESGSDSLYYEWLGFEIPEAVITTYKTTTQTIKLAICSGIGTNTAGVLNCAGFGMSRNDLGYSVSNARQITNGANGGSTMTLGSIFASRDIYVIGLNSTTGSATTGVRIPLPRIDRDIFLSVLAVGNTGGDRMQWIEHELIHSSGIVALGRPKRHIQSPMAVLSSNQQYQGFVVSGWYLPASMISAKSIKPAGSAVNYLELRLTNRNTNQSAVGVGYVAECAN